MTTAVGFLSIFLATVKDLPDSTSTHLKKIRELDFEGAQLEHECLQAERTIAAQVQREVQAQRASSSTVPSTVQLGTPANGDPVGGHVKDLELYREKRCRLATIDKEKVCPISFSKC